MDASVSLPDPGEFHHPTQNGHTPGLVIDDLAPFGPEHEDEGLELGPELIEAQARILEEELRAELERLDIDHLRDADESEVLPGFEVLTWSDLRHCPEWCADADLPVHGDGFDTTPESEIPHRGVPHDIPIKHGGKSLDHAGRAEVSAQLEQERDLATGPVITLSVVVRGIEQYAWLTIVEAKTLHRTLGQMLDDADGRS